MQKDDVLMKDVSEIRVELHSHTTYSHDGQIRLSTLISTAKKRQIDIVCITDHDTTEGAKKFQKEIKKRNVPLEIVIGEERTLDDKSHIIGLFLRENIVSHKFEDVVREIKEQGGTVVLPHPFRRKDGFLRLEENFPRALNANVDCYEIFNPKCSFDENTLAQKLKTSMRPLGGSDAHYEGELGECIITFQTTAGETPTESLRHVLNGNGRYSILGVKQTQRDSGRKYAATYYKYKKYFSIPKPLLPAVNIAYRYYRNTIVKKDIPLLETKRLF